MKHSAGRLAVVTGASSGIGFELAKKFAEDGFNLIIRNDVGLRIEGAMFEILPEALKAEMNRKNLRPGSAAQHH